MAIQCYKFIIKHEVNRKMINYENDQILFHLNLCYLHKKINDTTNIESFFKLENKEAQTILIFIKTKIIQKHVLS